MFLLPDSLLAFLYSRFNTLAQTKVKKTREEYRRRYNNRDDFSHADLFVNESFEGRGPGVGAPLTLGVLNAVRPLFFRIFAGLAPLRRLVMEFVDSTNSKAQ